MELISFNKDQEDPTKGVYVNTRKITGVEIGKNNTCKIHVSNRNEKCCIHVFEEPRAVYKKTYKAMSSLKDYNKDAHKGLYVTTFWDRLRGLFRC